MENRIQKINQKVDAFLLRRGFVHDKVRSLVRSQLYLVALTALCVGMVTGFSGWAGAYFSGAVLITINFWVLARVVQRLVFVRKGAVFALLFLFYGKLILSGLALYALIVLAHAPISGLLAGLTTAVANAILWGTTTFRHKAKEA